MDSSVPTFHHHYSGIPIQIDPIEILRCHHAQIHVVALIQQMPDLSRVVRRYAITHYQQHLRLLQHGKTRTPQIDAADTQTTPQSEYFHTILGGDERNQRIDAGLLLLYPHRHHDRPIIEALFALLGFRPKRSGSHFCLHLLPQQPIESARRVISLPLEEIGVRPLSADQPAPRKFRPFHGRSHRPTPRQRSQFRVRQAKRQRHRPGGDIVEQAVLKARSRLEKGGEQAVLRLSDRNDVRPTPTKLLIADFQVPRQLVHVDPVGAQ